MKNLLDQARRHWAAIILTLGGLGYISYWLTKFVAATPNPQTVGWPNAIGLAVGVWGLMISVAGFAVTWWQLARTQTAAAAVTTAMTRLKQDFASFELISEIRTARASAESASGHVAGDRWPEALQSYNSMRSSLSRMVAARDGLDERQLELAQDYLASALDACTSIERLHGSNPAELSKDVMNGKLRDFDTFLISLEVNLKESIRAG